MPPRLTLTATVPADVAVLVVELVSGSSEPKPNEPAVHAETGADAAAETGADTRADASVDVPKVQLERRAVAAVTAFGADAGQLIAVIRREKPNGMAGDMVAVPVDDRLVLAVSFGTRTTRDLRRAGAAVARRLKSVESAAVLLGRSVSDAQVRALVEGVLLAGYSFKMTSAKMTSAGTPDTAKAAGSGATRGPGVKPSALRSVALVVEGPADRTLARTAAIQAAVVTADATRLARDLANTPSSIKTPIWLAKQATALARKSGLEVDVLDERQLRAGGFGGVIAVGMGSANPPRLIELGYRPDPAIAVPGHVVLVGKGITFDSGGLSLKPTAGMVAMKTDMAAGGAIIAAMSALRDLGARVRVTALIPAAENMPSGSAQRPSDVITQFGGTTVEVLNTDAEGRLVLADALAYADAHLDPDVIVDLATLTGAISTALGKRHAGLFCSDDRLARVLAAAGDESGEVLWRMPFVDDYRAALESSVADLANVAVDGGKRFSGGSIVAALFLREFVGRRRWAHLDIAGVGRADGDEHELTKGATGFGVRLLLQWLTSPDPLRGLR